MQNGGFAEKAKYFPAMQFEIDTMQNLAAVVIAGDLVCG